MIYLDNAASTAIHDDVLTEMIPYLKDNFGNPSSIHKQGRIALKGIQKSRKSIANLINSAPEEILFTSGGTESNNTAILGIAHASKGKHIITSSIEHEAVLEPCRKLELDGFKVTIVPVNSDGLVNPIDIENQISDETCLVSIMWANNEVGAIQPIEKIASLCNHRNIPFHSDAVQAIGKVPINVSQVGIDLLSISSHKINGPKGVGALYIRKGTKINPIIFGGGQENGLRSGTENVANIVGFGKACQLAHDNLEKNFTKMNRLRDYLIKKISEEIPMTRINGSLNDRLPNNVHCTFLGVKGEDLIIKLDENGIAASTGSACSVNRQEASYVLKAMGYNYEQIEGSLRLSIGIFNSEEEISETVEILKNVVKELRKLSPLKEKYNF